MRIFYILQLIQFSYKTLSLESIVLIESLIFSTFIIIVQFKYSQRQSYFRFSVFNLYNLFSSFKYLKLIFWSFGHFGCGLIDMYLISSRLRFDKTFHSRNYKKKNTKKKEQMNCLFTRLFIKQMIWNVNIQCNLK